MTQFLCARLVSLSWGALVLCMWCRWTQYERSSGEWLSSAVRWPCRTCGSQGNWCNQEIAFACWASWTLCMYPSLAVNFLLL